MVTQQPRPSPDYEQLAMFKTPREILATHVGGDATVNDKAQKDMWKRKLKESKSTKHEWTGEEVPGPSRHASIKAEGVQKPVSLSTHYKQPTVQDGHHRLAAPNDIDPDRLIPVQHFGNRMNWPVYQRGMRSNPGLAKALDDFGKLV